MFPIFGDLCDWISGVLPRNTDKMPIEIPQLNLIIRGVFLLYISACSRTASRIASAGEHKQAEHSQGTVCDFV